MMADGSSGEKIAKTKWQRYRDLKDFWPTWLIKSFLPQKSVALLYGARGQGKTFLALDWAASVAAGSDWQGHPVEGGGKVAYLLAERAEGLRRRLMGWLECRRGDENLLNGNLVAAQGIFRLGMADERAKLVDSLRQTAGFEKLSLLVIDPLASYYTGSENDAADMQAFVDGLRDVSEALECTVLVIHHEGKGGRKYALGARGSSALEAGMDTVIHLVPGAKKTDRSQLVVTKQREFETRDKIHLEFKPIGSDRTRGAGFKDLGIFPEIATTPREGDAASINKPKKAQRLRELDVAIVTAIDKLTGLGLSASVDMILGEVQRDYAGDNVEIAKLNEQNLRSRLAKLERGPEPRLESTKDGVLCYTVIERRANTAAG